MAKKFSRLRGYILLSDYTMEDLAETIGLSYSTLSNKLNGKSEFTLSEILRIGEALHIQRENLLDAFTKEINNHDIVRN